MEKAAVFFLNFGIIAKISLLFIWNGRERIDRVWAIDFRHISNTGRVLQSEKDVTVSIRCFFFQKENEKRKAKFWKFWCVRVFGFFFYGASCYWQPIGGRQVEDARGPTVFCLVGFRFFFTVWRSRVES